LPQILRPPGGDAKGQSPFEIVLIKVEKKDLAKETHDLALKQKILRRKNSHHLKALRLNALHQPSQDLLHPGYIVQCNLHLLMPGGFPTVNSYSAFGYTQHFGE
jgi:hypothetical protein